MRIWIVAAAAALASTAAHAQPPHDLALGEPMADWPGADYNPAIPTLKSVLGYAPGAEITTHADAMRYLDALKAAAPDRVRIVEIGRSWQGRALKLAIISAPENMARLDQIQADLQRLADPEGADAAEAQRLAATLPAPVWLAYSVHGDEISGTDAGLQTAYHLLAARGDGRVSDMLRNTIVILHPTQNPDGRDRFIASTRAARGLEVDPDPASAERDQPWPGGRVNHYLFDLNRDWFALTQPETRAHVRAVLAWTPVVLADIHEMSGESTYFFPPAAAPTNPLQTKAQMAMRDEIGRNHARWFDRFGVSYFTRDVYDLFYPGYGDGWPSYQGAVSMTYEQGSARGLSYKKRDGTRFSFGETVLNQTVTSLSTIEVAAQRRQQLLENLRRYRVDATAEGRKLRDRTLIIPPQQDQAGADRFARTLAAQGVRVGRAREAFSQCGARYPAGTYVIDKAQPTQRLISVLTDARIPLEAEFVAEQERRRARGLPDEIYDVTAWSLPMLYNVKIERCGGAPKAPVDAVDPEAPALGSLANPGASVAFLAPWGDSAAVRLLVAAVNAGLKASSADEAFTLDGVRYPAGTLIFPVKQNPANLAERLAEFAQATGARVQGVDTSWVTDGPSFGARDVPSMPKVRVALAWDEPASPNAAGATRWVLERRFGQSVSAIRTDALNTAALERFDVVILPSGDYGDAFGEGDRAALKDWVERGGVLIGLGEAMRFLAEPDSNLLSVRREDAVKSEDADADGNGEEDDAATRPGTILESEADLRNAIEPETSPPDSVAGVIVRAASDQEHWMAAGVSERLHMLYAGGDIYTPAKLDAGVNVVRFAGPNDLLASGYLWEENRKQLAYKPAVVLEEHGRGIVVGFVVDPTTRGFSDGLDVLLANAIYRAAAQARPSR